jgi:hypothetical protein
VISLSHGPRELVRKYGGFIINGFRFHTRHREEKRKTQNSGVLVNVGDIEYFGILEEIIELQYDGRLTVVLFKCVWYDVETEVNRIKIGVKENEFGFTLVNSKKYLRTTEPFVLASQVLQVFYVDDPGDKDWRIVFRVTPRDLFDMSVD